MTDKWGRVAYIPKVLGVAAAILYRFLILLGPIECLPIVSVVELCLAHIGIVLVDSEIFEKEALQILDIIFRSIDESSLPTN